MSSRGKFQAAATAYASGQRFIEKDNRLVMADGRPPTLASVFPLTEERDYAERLRKLLSAALTDCLTQLAERGQESRSYPMLLLLPYWMEGGPVADDFKARLQQSPLAQVDRLAILYGAQAESLRITGLYAPEQVIKTGQTVLVATVDSYIHTDLLDSLAYHGELLTRHNPYGMVPGEAAVVLALGLNDDEPLGKIMRLTTMEEPESPIDMERGLMGRALANCYQALLEGGFSPDRFIVDLNGDRLRAEEFGYAIAVNAAKLAKLSDRAEVPALQLGDLGAASGLVMMALALQPPAKSFQPNTVPVQKQSLYSLLSASSRSGLRAAMILESVQRNATSTGIGT